MPDDGNDVILEESDDDEANESITIVEPSDEWSDMRMKLAGHMTEEEDNKLIESLLELNNNGRFKAEGSFKPGHLKELEKNIHEKLPRCDLLAKPYIESRMKTLKTHFYIVHGILTGPNCSCFRWDIEKKTLTVEKHVWDAFIQSHKEVAPGQHAETPADVEEQLQNEEGDYNGDDNASSENVDNASDNNVVINLASKSSKRSQSQTDCSSTSKKQRKTKSSGDLAEALTESTATFAAVIEKSSARLSKAIGEDLNEKRILLDELKDDWAKGILAGTIYVYMIWDQKYGICLCHGVLEPPIAKVLVFAFVVFPLFWSCGYGCCSGVPVQ
ncbi:hypothetical protein QYF36_023017 [Acer negundo]|nr:hypothetical protein QYF36_023017 [Acer negundo]